MQRIFSGNDNALVGEDGFDESHICISDAVEIRCPVGVGRRPCEHDTVLRLPFGREIKAAVVHSFSNLSLQN